MLFIIGLLGLTIAAVAILLHLYLNNRFKKNTITINGKIKPIPHGFAIVTFVRGLIQFLSGSFRGEKGVKLFQQQVLEAEAKNPNLRCGQGTIIFFPTITLWSAEYAKLVLFSKDTEMKKSNLGSSLTEDFFGDSILLADGDKWKEHKTVLSPAFTYKHVQSIIPAFIDIARQLEAQWFKNQNEKSVKISDWIKKATLEAIGRGGFGFNFRALYEGSETKEIKTYESLMKEFENPIHFFEFLDKLLGSRARIDRYLEEFGSFMHNLIVSKREMIKEAGPSWKPEDILDFLLSAEQNHALSDRQIAHDMNTFFIAGHETTAGALCSALHFLSENIEAQEKLRDEITSICETNDPTYEDIKKMTYLDYCLKETLRLVPPAFGVSRTTTKDQDVGDLHVAKGTIMFVNIFAMHRAAEYFGNDANEFKPERFENKNLAPSGAYIPFSIGPRQCIGNNFAILEMKCFLAVLIQKFRFSVDPNSKPANIVVGTVLTINTECTLIVSPA